MYPSIMFRQQFKHLYNVSLKWDIANTKTYPRDATECINLIGCVLFAIIKAIFSNGNDLDLIMN